MLSTAPSLPSTSSRPCSIGSRAPAHPAPCAHQRGDGGRSTDGAGGAAIKARRGDPKLEKQLQLVEEDVKKHEQALQGNVKVVGDDVKMLEEKIAKLLAEGK